MEKYSKRKFQICHGKRLEALHKHLEGKYKAVTEDT